MKYCVSTSTSFFFAARPMAIVKAKSSSVVSDPMPLPPPVRGLVRRAALPAAQTEVPFVLHSFQVCVVSRDRPERAGSALRATRIRQPYEAQDSLRYRGPFARVRGLDWFTEYAAGRALGQHSTTLITGCIHRLFLRCGRSLR